MRSFCIFCKSGCEQSVAQVINSQGKAYKAIAPKRVLQEKRNGVWQNRELPLLPGYVFLYVNDDDNDNSKRDANSNYLSSNNINSNSNNSSSTGNQFKSKDMYKMLQYDTGIKELSGDDMKYATWIYNNSGYIKSSRIFECGDEIKVTEGPLHQCMGRIVNLDKHKRRVIVEFDFDGCKRTISLSADCISTCSVEAS